MTVFATPFQVMKDLHSTKSTIKVFLRARPLLDKEILEGAQNILSLLPREKQVLVDEGTKGQFTYDGVCDENASQEDVFQMVVSPFLKHIHNGYNVTVMAYGQTGSGKTYTIGTNPVFSQENGGTLQRVLKYLLNSNEDVNMEHNVQCLRMSYLEVYNESVYDLFSNRKIVETKPDGFGGVSPIAFKEETISTIDEGLCCLEKGNSQRKVTATAMNSHSSRSHAIISLSAHQKENECAIAKGCLRMVDLAGAEGVGRNKMEGQGFCEGVAINKGLLTIGKVLVALSSNGPTSHVPYRESMITRLLRDALGGNSYTIMITCVSPASTNLFATLNTLRYAEQARNIRNKPIGFSTIKRRDMKRRLEDVSATPNAWKKFAFPSGNSDQNATISTPGHKPTLTRTQPLNNTFATPFHRMSDVSRNWLRSSSRTDLTPAVGVPLRQPTFEEEEDAISPTHSIITAPPTKSSLLQISPLVERVNSRLEQSILQGMQSQMKDMENRLAKRVVRMLIGGTQSKRRSKRLQIKKESKLEITAISRVKKLINNSTQSSLDSNDSKESSFSFADPIAEALMQKCTFQNALESAFIKDENGPYDESIDQYSSREKATTYIKQAAELPMLNTRKPFAEISNLDNSRIMSETVLHPRLDSEDCFLPMTSTIVRNDKAVRRSARLSARASGVIYSAPNSIATKRSYFISPLHQTLASPSVRLNTISLADSDGSSNEFCNTVIFNKDYCCASPPHLKRNSTTVTLARRENISFLQVSPTRKAGGRKRSTAKQTDFSLLPELPCDGGRRRSCRRSVLIASQRNYDILNAMDNSLTRESRKSCSKVVSKLVANVNVTEDKWRIVISPTLQKKHSDGILKILNTKNLRELQKLPTIGPKTAMVILNYRKLYGKLAKVEDIQKIPGLPKSYYSRFIKANLMQQIDFS